MSGNRFALLIGSYQYEDPNFSILTAPSNDVEALARVLRDPTIGEFDVKISLNKPHYIVRQQIEEFFQDRKKDDLLLLYFSGHGFKEIGGQLYFVATDTKLKLLRSTGISARDINDFMENSTSKRQVLILDCCFSGAFIRGMTKGDKKTNIQSYFDEGVGKVVLTSSDAMQYSFEGENITEERIRSIFTNAIVHGLETGEADINEDNWVSVDDLYQYVDTNISSGSQRPTISNLSKQGDIVIARNPKPKSVVNIISDKDDSIIIARELDNDVNLADRYLKNQPLVVSDNIALSMRKNLLEKRIVPRTVHILPYLKSRDPSYRVVGYIAFQVSIKRNRLLTNLTDDLIWCLTLEQETIKQQKESRPLWQLLLCLDLLLRSEIEYNKKSSIKEGLGRMLEYLDSDNTIDTGGECKSRINKLLS